MAKGDRILSVQLTPAERYALEIICRIRGETLSRYCATAIATALQMDREAYGPLYREMEQQARREAKEA